VPGAVFTLQVPESSPWHGKTVTVREFRWMNSTRSSSSTTSTTGAESMVRAILWVDQDESPSAEDDAWYDHQLVVSTSCAMARCRPSRPRRPPACAGSPRRAHSGHDEILVPFVSAIVPEVDVAGTVTVTPPAGLFEVARRWRRS
jgi:16S rRNA processing protein RimM